MTLLCVAAVSLVSNALLFDRLMGIIDEKSDRLQNVYLTTMQTQLNEYIENAVTLLILCANDNVVATATRAGATLSSSMLSAQSRLNAHLDASVEESYIDKLLAFHSSGVMIQASTRMTGQLTDVDEICQLPLYQAYRDGTCDAPCTIVLSKAIGDSKGSLALAMIAPIYNQQGTSGSYIYLELGLDRLISGIEPYINLNNVFLVGSDGTLLSEMPSSFSDDFDISLLNESTFRFADKTWQCESVELQAAGLTLYACDQIGMTGRDGEQLVFILLIVFATVLLLAVVLAILVSTYISHPIRRLDARIRRITNNDFSFDPEIEEPQDELGEIGHTVNEMTMSINHLLRETEDMYTKRKNIEIELLQSQVNPHFLYNTLDTIRWMAVIQQCPGIASTVGSLVNLLKTSPKALRTRFPCGKSSRCWTITSPFRMCGMWRRLPL